RLTVACLQNARRHRTATFHRYAGRPMHTARSVVPAAWIAYAGFYLCRKNFSVLMPLYTEHIGASRELLANVLFVYSAAYGIGQVTMGMLADRIAPHRVVVGGMLISAAATFAMGFTSEPAMLYVWLGINGLAQACGWPSLTKIVGSWFEPVRR